MIRRWPAYAAAGWSLLFAAQSLASVLIVMAGSSWGADLFGADLARMAREGDVLLIVELWVAVVAKACGVPFALALLRPWAHRTLTVLGYVGGGLVLLYGLANLVEHVLMATGAVAIPAGLGAHALPWHLGLWDPFWIAGGLLLLYATRNKPAPA